MHGTARHRPYHVRGAHATARVCETAAGERSTWCLVHSDTDLDARPALQIDYLTVAFAVHRLNGIVTPANAAYSAPELAHQLKSSGAKALFVGGPQLQVALEAAEAAGLPRDKIWIMGMPGFEEADGFVSVETLITEGSKAPTLDVLRWNKGQGARQTAFLCYSSGTSGLPKAVMISHRNV